MEIDGGDCVYTKVVINLSLWKKVILLFSPDMRFSPLLALNDFLL